MHRVSRPAWRSAISALLIAAALGCQPAPTAQRAQHAQRPQHEDGHVDLWPAAPQEALPASKVSIVIDCGVIRSHPLGARVMAILAALPEWKQLTLGTPLDVARDVDRILVTGPSLVDTSRDAVVIGYSAADADIEKAILGLLSQGAGSDSKDASIDVGISTVRAWRLFANGRDRAFLRGPAHVLAVTPAKHANAYARELAGGSLVATSEPGAALSLRAVAPGRSWRFIPDTIREMRVRLVPRKDGGADLYGEGDCADDATAAKVAADLESRATTAAGAASERGGGALVVESRADGSTAKVHVSLTSDQLDELLGFAMTYLGVVPRYR